MRITEALARTVGYWRATGQTTMLCTAARHYEEATGERPWVVTATAMEAERLRKTFGVQAESIQNFHKFAGRRGVLYLIDNQVMCEVGHEYRVRVADLHHFRDRVERLDVEIDAVGRHNEELRQLADSAAWRLHGISDENIRLRAELELVRSRLEKLRLTRSRRTKRRRKRRSKNLRARRTR